MRKKVIAMFTAVVLAGSLFASAGVADSNNARESLVALGDSITFGFNLGVDNEEPSEFAFPYLIENDVKDFHVNNLAVPGLRSDELLNALRYDKKFRQPVKHAEAIVVNIGSNDLLQVLQDINTDPLALEKAIPKMLENLDMIIKEIRTLTDAPIVVYNIYNPFLPNTELHILADTLLPGIHEGISNIVDSQNDQDIVVANAYLAFGDNQAVYVREGDIHPTTQGQEILADLAEEALGLN